jgi:hypothetical protein
MSVTATLTIPQIVSNIGLNSVQIDLENQRFMFVGGGSSMNTVIAKRYDPTLGEWNYIKTGLTAFFSRLPGLTNVVVDINYDIQKHPNPGTFEQ